jgi:hypothetical protein
MNKGLTPLPQLPPSMATRAPAFVADALWHCLCPSFSRSLLNASVRPLASHQQLRKGIRRVTSPAAAPTWGVTTPKEPQIPTEYTSETIEVERSSLQDHALPQTSRAATSEHSSQWNSLHKNTAAAETQKDLTVGERLVAPLLLQLEDVAAAADKPKVQKLVVRLLRDFGMSPDARMYTVLLLAEADPWHGSAAEVERLLSQADLDGISRNSAVYHAALKVSSGQWPKFSSLTT